MVHVPVYGTRLTNLLILFLTMMSFLKNLFLFQMKKKDSNAQHSHLKCRKALFDGISERKTNGVSSNTL